jgi:phosphoheptose isomerase
MIPLAPPIRLVEERLRERNRVAAAFFERESARLAVACQGMAERFLRGGRLLAFGRDHYATDAQHVSVEFVHPVIVGKRALPVEADAEALARMLALTGGRRAVPVLVEEGRVKQVGWQGRSCLV